MSKKTKLIIGVDFDGTIVEHQFPNIGPPVPHALEVLRFWNEKNIARIVLWTMRSGDRLQEALWYLDHEGIEIWAANENPTQGIWTTSPKAYCHMYIDDAALGCPLFYPKNGERPYVDWLAVEKMRLERLQQDIKLKDLVPLESIPQLLEKGNR